jgi:hypothetical protein
MLLLTHDTIIIGRGAGLVATLKDLPWRQPPISPPAPMALRLALTITPSDDCGW